MQAIVRARAFWLLWLTLLVAKLLLAARLPLFGDEAWYWLEAASAWAYSDLPGPHRWMIRAGVELFGNDRLAVRVPFVLLSMGVPLLIVATSRRWFGPDACWIGGIAALLLPLLGGLGFLALPDVPLTFAAAASIYAMSRLRDAVNASLLWLGVALARPLCHYASLSPHGGRGRLFADPSRAASCPPTAHVADPGALAWLPLVHWNLCTVARWFVPAGRTPPMAPHGGSRGPAGQHSWSSRCCGWRSSHGVAAARRWRRAEPGPWQLIVVSAMLPLMAYGVLGFVADRERVSFHWTLQAYLPLLAALPLVWNSMRARWRVATLASAAVMWIAVHAFAWVAATPAGRATLAESRWYPDISRLG